MVNNKTEICTWGSLNTGSCRLNERRTEGVCLKLQPAFIGPWVIVERINDQDYLVHQGKNGRQIIIHHDKLKPYKWVNYPVWGRKIKSKTLNRQ